MTEEVKKIKCPVCGTELDAGTEKCFNCGTVIEQGEEEKKDNKDNQEKVKNDEEDKKTEGKLEGEETGQIEYPKDK